MFAPYLGVQNLQNALGAMGVQGLNPFAQQQMDYQSAAQEMEARRQAVLRHAMEWSNSRSVSINAPNSILDPPNKPNRSWRERVRKSGSVHEILQSHVREWLSDVELPA